MKKEILVERYEHNPIIEPNSGIPWMSKNVFNCGAIFENGWYKMLFRAARTNNQEMSVCGLAFSREGTKWHIFKEPVLMCHSNEPCDKGIEDPRIVKWIDGWNYIFATAYSSAGARIGIWRTKNFFDYEWIGAPFDWEDKDASIFPEPIGGWAYLLHRKAPHIWISRTQDFTLRRGWQNTQILTKFDEWYLSPNTGNMPVKIGIAGPPIKTPKGWLLIVHTVHGKGENMFNRVYSLGFMLLDLQNPTEIKYIHPASILWPTEKYETTGAVPFVCFSNATVDPGGDAIHIFWGGGDTVLCGGRIYKDDLWMCY